MKSGRDKKSVIRKMIAKPLLMGEGSKKNIRIKKKYSRRIKKKIFWGSKKNIPNVENIYDFEGAATR